MKKIFLSLSSLTLVTLSFAQPAMWGTPVAPRPESEALAQSVPIADVHMHFNIMRQTVEQMLQRMQQGNIRWGGGVGDYTDDMQVALGNRYILAIGQTEFTKVLMSSGEKGLQNLEHLVKLAALVRYILTTKLQQVSTIHLEGQFHWKALWFSECTKLPMNTRALFKFITTKAFAQSIRSLPCHSAIQNL